MKTSWQFSLDPRWNLELGGGSPPPVYQPPAPTPPDPFATAQAQQGYNINSAIAQNQLNNTNQITPYGDITYQQTGGSYVGASPALAATPATGGYWNGSSWVPTGGTPGHPATQGQFVPQFTATTTLNPEVKKLASQQLYNSQGNAQAESNLLANVQNTVSKPLDLSWGNIASNIYGLEKNTLDPQWAQNQQVSDQALADQGLTPGSQGWKYQKTQFGLDKSNAYNQAMLQAQNTAVNDITTQYNSPVNTLSALRSNSQIQQPGLSQLAPSSTSNVSPANYAGIAQGNYQIGSQNFNTAEQLQQSQYQAQQQQQSQLLGGLFGLAGNLISPAAGLISDRRDKTDIKELGKHKETGLPLYAYRYKDDPKTYPKVVGPMAQDVRKIAPEATSEVDGHLTIDTGALSNHFGIGPR